MASTVIAAVKLTPEARQAGFMNGTASPHTTRTIMLAELRTLLASSPHDANRTRYRSAVVEDNVLLKRTVTTRRKTFIIMGQVYALSPDVLLFRALRDLWDADPVAQPLIATLCALARDPIFLTTASVVLDAPLGTVIGPEALSMAVDTQFPSRFSDHSLKSIGQNAISSWHQAGHLHGIKRKVRQRATSRPTAVAYALLLGTLLNVRGDALFQTLWARTLDAPEHALREQARVAGRQGWLDYRSTGDITEVNFSHLLRPLGVPDERG
jgi:hypothetical protein